MILAFKNYRQIISYQFSVDGHLLVGRSTVLFTCLKFGPRKPTTRKRGPEVECPAISNK